jgi:hypothetical protein
MVHMDPLAFLIAHHTTRRTLDGSQPGGARRSRPTNRARRVRS